MRNQLTDISCHGAGKQLARPIGPRLLHEGRNCLANLAGKLSPGARFAETRDPTGTIADFYRGGLTAGANAGRDFLSQVPTGDLLLANRFSAALQVSLGSALARMKRDGANSDDESAWCAGFMTGIVPYAIAWNYRS